MVEVLSPSNTTREIVKKKALCLNAGCREFWLIDPVGQFVEVSPANSGIRLYRRGDQIPVGTFHVTVDDIFSEDELD